MLPEFGPDNQLYVPEYSSKLPYELAPLRQVAEVYMRIVRAGATLSLAADQLMPVAGVTPCAYERDATADQALTIEDPRQPLASIVA